MSQAWELCHFTMVGSPDRNDSGRKVLDKLGANGWELVSVVILQPPVAHVSATREFYFKRPKQPRGPAHDVTFGPLEKRRPQQ